MRRIDIVGTVITCLIFVILFRAFSFLPSWILFTGLGVLICWFFRHKIKRRLRNIFKGRLFRVRKASTESYIKLKDFDGFDGIDLGD